MWCGGGHVYKECPEKGNTASIPTCCSYKLVDEEELSKLQARQGRDAKEEVAESAQNYNGTVHGGAAQQHTAASVASRINSLRIKASLGLCNDDELPRV
jgi:hypothetical protein